MASKKSAKKTGKTAKTSKVSFNQFVVNSEFFWRFDWIVTRGRLSAASVEARTLKMGLPPGTGEKAYAAYLTA